MKKTIVLLTVLCIYLNENYAQEPISKDGVRNNYGISLEVESGFNAAFYLIGFDYNHRINNRFSLGAATCLGADEHESPCYKYKIMLYFRTDLSKSKYSPFIDFGAGYNLIFWRTASLNSPDIINTKTSKDFFISSRIGFYPINKKKYNLSIVIEYQKFFVENGFFGLGITCNLKK